MGCDGVDCVKIGCAPQTLNEWVKKLEVDTGQRCGITTEQAEKMKALECEVRELKHDETLSAIGPRAMVE